MPPTCDAPAQASAPQTPHLLPPTAFGIVLGLAALGRAWRLAADTWHVPPLIGEGLLTAAALAWVVLVVPYLMQWRHQDDSTLPHALQDGGHALPAIATLQLVPALLPHSLFAAWVLGLLGIGWQLAFALWHTGRLWRGGHPGHDATPALYLPTVAGNFTSGATLGMLGQPDFGWLLVGAGLFSWLSLESLVVRRLWKPGGLPPAQRAQLGIQFAPPMVCGAACIALAPHADQPWLPLLWGYGLFQLLLGLRMAGWLGASRFDARFAWAYSFGIGCAAICAVRLAETGNHAAHVLALPVFIAANAVIGWLGLRTLFQWARPAPGVAAT
ncbi:dicarboxylate transporter/tellurite-resistance protein TehA [Cupriavidus sp. RAF12]|uniref:SLAC1 family transporter n=1 Tax=Cupriavidus sp. RAF12 TaxID=3233050 RepID=UPI003F928BBF